MERAGPKIMNTGELALSLMSSSTGTSVLCSTVDLALLAGLQALCVSEEELAMPHSYAFRWAGRW